MKPEVPSKVDTIKVHDEFQILGFFGDYRFLSNFHLCSVWFEGDRYPSSENAYQAAKVTLENRFHFITCTPAESKNLWKKLPRIYTESEWNNAKYAIMARIVTEKFLFNKELGDDLLSTYNRYLEETNWWKDTYWGVCDQRGENNLGKILMLVRQMLRP